MKWILPGLIIGVGLLFHLATLMIWFAHVRRVLRKEITETVSAFPLIGPIIIAFGLYISSASSYFWIGLISLTIEICFGFICKFTIKKNQSNSSPA